MHLNVTTLKVVYIIIYLLRLLQQYMMRQAAILAKLVPDTPKGRARVKFVTEGESSLHCCLHERIVEVVRLTPYHCCYLIITRSSE